MGVSTINLGSTLRRSANKCPDRTALVSHDGERLSYRQFEGLSNRFANGLKRLGLKKGDKVAIFSPNSNEQLIAFFGVLKSGGVVVPINTRFAGPEMAWVMDHSDASLLIFSKDFEDKVQGLRTDLKGVKSFVSIGAASFKHARGFQEILDQGDDEDPAVGVFGDDDAFMVYTGGTTGRPKGALLTHNSIIWNCVNWAHSKTYREGDLVLQVFPLYHVAAIGSVLTSLYLGGTIYLKKTFDPRDCMETIQRERITRWAAAPTVFNVIVQLPDIDRYDTSSVTLLGSGAAIMPIETASRLRRVFPNAQMFDSYGMTEASGGITTLCPQDASRKLACVGTPLIGVEMRVLDDRGVDVALGEIGEIVFRGNNLMRGYYKDAAATEEAMRGGWMHTGDLGRLDAEGFLYIVDRKNDLIITGAENVYPREVEEALFAHPLVVEAAVIGVPDAKWGEAIKAVVTLRPGATVSEREIIDHCRQRIAGFKSPKSVDFVPELPKNPAGKILKRVLRERYGKSVTYLPSP